MTGVSVTSVFITMILSTFQARLGERKCPLPALCQRVWLGRGSWVVGLDSHKSSWIFFTLGEIISRLPCWSIKTDLPVNQNVACISLHLITNCNNFEWHFVYLFPVLTCLWHEFLRTANHMYKPIPTERKFSKNLQPGFFWALTSCKIQNRAPCRKQKDA